MGTAIAALMIRESIDVTYTMPNYAAASQSAGAPWAPRGSGSSVVARPVEQ